MNKYYYYVTFERVVTQKEECEVKVSADSKEEAIEKAKNEEYYYIDILKTNPISTEGFKVNWIEKKKEIRLWLIKASASIYGTDTYYIAYSENNPESISEWDDITNEITEELWENYSYLLHPDEEEYDSDEEYDVAYGQAYENFKCDCSISVEETTEKYLLDYAPGGNLDAIEIVYDERG